MKPSALPKSVSEAPSVIVNETVPLALLSSVDPTSTATPSTVPLVFVVRVAGPASSMEDRVLVMPLPTFSDSVNTASSVPSGVRAPAAAPTRSTRIPAYCSDVYPCEGGSDGVVRTATSVAGPWLPTESTA
jgi:hypothetical protein